MDIKSFKKLVLKSFKQSNDKEYRIFSDNLLDLLKDKNDNELLTSEDTHEIKRLLGVMWLNVSENVKPGEWSLYAQTNLMLVFMESLIQHDILKHNDRSELLYPPLQGKFIVNNSQLTLDQIMNVLIFCSRLTGYRIHEEKENLITELDREINQAKSLWHVGELGKLQITMTSLFVLYYLLQEHCTTVQIELVLMAVQFRKNTTKEEQGTESAIIKFLSRYPSDCKAFLRQELDFIETRTIKETDCLCSVNEFILHNKPSISNYLLFSGEVYQFAEFYAKANKKNEELIFQTALNYIHNSYVSKYQTRSFETAFSYAKKLIKEASTFKNPRQKQIFQKGVYGFCLQEYIHDRKLDKHFTFFSFSAKTKIATAKELLLSLHKDAALSFTQSFAAKQGRLSEIVNLFEKEQKPPSLKLV
ncbi:hypothetical protein FOG18_02580 [Legionella israelensis]|uniref:hypothetical protein n=1 Tax=Legionella israelensis TaxID=454 RepID=UPI0011812953|nr:hypothetical protein [Legionella israelensis]QDP71537.1 hypothetical protein FOG18_02580 [Legionella israelensis]